MPSETFFCPHCHRQLTKSAQAYVMGEMMGSGGGRYVGVGSGMAQTVTCPGCGGAIDADRMIRGEYDGGRPMTGWEKLFNVVFLIAVVAVLIWIFR
jgi:hypothetical protein